MWTTRSSLANEESRVARPPAPRSAALRDHVSCRKRAADSTIMAIAEHVSRKMEAKRTAMETLANISKIAVCDTSRDTNALPWNVALPKLLR